MVFSSIMGGMGGAGPKYRGFKPKKGNLREYEAKTRSDVDTLYSGKNPYESDPSLGYSQRTQQEAIGLGEGSRTAEKQNLYDAYVGNKGYGEKSREFLSAQSGVDRSQREDSERMRAGIRVASADKAREDFFRRHGATAGAYDQGAGLYNAYAANKYGADVARHEQKQNRYRAVGGLMDMGMLAMGGI